jgi:hypothetical protein
MKALLVFLLLVLSCSAQPGQMGRDLVRARSRRLALVIGNDAHPGMPCTTPSMMLEA